MEHVYIVLSTLVYGVLLVMLSGIWQHKSILLLAMIGLWVAPYAWPLLYIGWLFDRHKETRIAEDDTSANSPHFKED